MRGKRSKQYRKLMQQYGITFGFREPYQVLLDADIIKDAGRFKMDLVGGLEKALHGKVKPSTSSPNPRSLYIKLALLTPFPLPFTVITQCSMRHLYTSDPAVPELIEQAKTYERRRCNHHTLEEPLTTLECFSSVVDPKSSGTNKHRYVVASQTDEVRTFMRSIPGVPLVYIRRSVMILEPMAGATEDVREREERRKFRSTLTGKSSAPGAVKRKRVEDTPGDTAGDARLNAGQGEDDEAKRKKKRKGPKGPNPLSVKKPKKRPAKKERVAGAVEEDGTSQTLVDGVADGQPNPAHSGAPDLPAKTKRKRKHGAHGNHSAEKLGVVSTLDESAKASEKINES